MLLASATCNNLCVLLEVGHARKKINSVYDEIASVTVNGQFRLKNSNRSIALLLSAVLLIALAATVSFRAIGQMEVAAEARSHTRHIINTAEGMLFQLLKPANAVLP